MRTALIAITIALLRGHVVPAPFYDELVRVRAACRARAPAAARP